MNEHRTQKIALFGGIYSNHIALTKAIEDARDRSVDDLYCLGDLGAFGPHPDRTIDILRDNNIKTMQGNYDNSIGSGLNDCQCGYTDPRDNHYARISYQYTFEKTSPKNRAWLNALPLEHRFTLGGRNVLLCHGSPRRVNEFLFSSTTPSHLLQKFCRDYGCDVLGGTHSGIHWDRVLGDNQRFVNVGVLGRPENDGTTRVWYSILSTREEGAGIDVEFVPIEYDHERLAQEMKEERLPDEFVATIRTGWWTTCLEILPAKERRLGKH